MKRRITGLSVVMLLLFGLIIGQSVFLQVLRASALDQSSINPRIRADYTDYARGEILSSNGTVLARSIPTGVVGAEWRRSYPFGSLTSGLVGWSSIQYGTWGLENEYLPYLVNHVQPARSLSQLIAPVRGADTLTTTLSIPLQQVAARALQGQEGSVVALDPRTGAILALYSNPTYNPAPMTSVVTAIQAAWWKHITTANANNFEPLATMALQDTFPPGSTMKVVTTAAILRYDPSLANVSWGPAACLSLVPYNGNPDKPLCNAGGSTCGGTIQQMLPASCDPGYAYLGIQLGADYLYDESTEFGYNATPPIDLPSFEVKPSYFPPAADYKNLIPQLGYSAIGQWNVRATALQDALVAAGIADGGKVMAPHLMRQITGPEGNVVAKWRAHMWRHPLGPIEASQVSALMVDVAQYGTASGIFLPQDDVAAKTGTAQTGNALNNTDDWMIAFAPANDPVVAAAVVLPYQPQSAWGATVAGPVMKCVIEGALAIATGQPAANTYATCPS
jgi:peptidoglycan glycosyltransferase